MAEQFEVLVIGGGQAGLAAGYHLARQGRRFAILEQSARIGDSWRNRWGSLTLFTSARYSQLPGRPFPADPDSYPRKDEVADYLESYAEEFRLPVRVGCRVKRVRPAEGGYQVDTEAATLQADQLVIATGPFQTPYRPPLAAELPAEVCALHSSEYRDPEQLPPGDVLVVGAGDTGVQLAEELARTRKVYLSEGGRHLQLPQRLLGRDVFAWLYRAGIMSITIESRLGQRLSRRATRIGPSPAMLARKHRVVLLDRAQGVRDGGVVFADGRQLRPRNVIWATGFRSDYDWIEVPVFDARGEPDHRRGVTTAPGFYFLGLLWQYRRDSALLAGVGRDAAFIAAQIAARGRQ
jgi:putative flavoprotein involved in K+ transport